MPTIAEATPGMIEKNDASAWLDLLRCPMSGGSLRADGKLLVSNDGAHRYRIAEEGIPLFAEQWCSPEAAIQKAHYDNIAGAYKANLTHTLEYMAYLDRALLRVLDPSSLGTVAEVCCGNGEAFHILGNRFSRGVGVDISLPMLTNAVRAHPGARTAFVQGDATKLPLASGQFDSVFMLGGIHHVNDRAGLFSEVARILKPGGMFYFREPVDDFWLWRAIRQVIYRWSPLLDDQTERPLRYQDTVPVLDQAGFKVEQWQTVGFLGFCLFMNSDVLIFNRLFRFIPGIRGLTRGATCFDDWTTSLPGFRRAGLQVIGAARSRR
jgi:ubiquinone/menaquinone biosynthesis C-methylase UbiE